MARKKVRTKTQVWENYERGRAYNNGLVPNQYRLVNTNIEFFAGNQWLHLPETPAMSRLPKPMFNIIKRVTSLFVASLTSSATTIAFEPLAYYDGTNEADPSSNAAAFATAEVQNLLEKFKMDYRIRDALFDGAQTGDYCAHFYWDPDALPYGGAFGPYRGEIQMELVDGLNVMFGNPNDRCVERQPYILIIGRDTVENLREEAERNRKFRPKDESSGDFLEYAIQPDYDTAWQAGIGGKHELMPDDDGTGKALYCYMYYKVTANAPVIDPKTGQPMMEVATDRSGNPIIEKDENGKPIISNDGTPQYKMKKVMQPTTTVHVTKATKTCTIFEDVDTGLTRYPIAWGNWERQKNQYHGRALVTGIVPNQIFINSMFAMVMRHLQQLGFPKEIYNADVISQWTNEVGQAIGVRGMQPGQNIQQVAYTLQPADMSNQIIATIDKAVAYTKDCLGATDAQLGNVRPDNTSALMVLQSAAEVPLENTRANLHEWMEDIGAILLDMMGTYYGERPIVRERKMDELVQQTGGTPQIDPFSGLMSTQSVTRKVVETFDFSQFKHLYLNVRVNVGATTYFSEIAMVQTLDNLRRDGVLSMIQYLERVPDRLVPQKEELIENLKAQAKQKEQELATQQQMQMNNGIIPGSDGQAIGSMSEAQEAAAGAAEAAKHKKLPPSGTNPVAGGAIDNAKAFAALPPGIQARFQDIPGARTQATVLNHGRILAK